MRNVKGKHVVITGGSSGIGLACAKRFYTEGANVTIMARNVEKLNQAKREIEELAESLSPEEAVFNPQVRTFAADASDCASIKAAIDRAYDEQPIDILLCNAGIVRTGLAEDLSQQDVEDQIHTNLLGSIFPAQAVIPSMKARASAGDEPGVIIFMCSLSAMAHWFGASVYAATKYGIRGFAETLRLELKPYGIQVSLLCPNFTETPLLEGASQTSSDYIQQMMGHLCLYNRRGAESPDNIARKAIEVVRSGEFLALTSINPVTMYIRVQSRGVIPAISPIWWIPEVALLSCVRLASHFIWFYLWTRAMMTHRWHFPKKQA